MPDEATIPKNGEDTITGQAPPDVPTPPMDSINSPQGEPVSPPPSESATAPESAPVEPPQPSSGQALQQSSGQATPSPNLPTEAASAQAGAAAPAPETPQTETPTETLTPIETQASVSESVPVQAPVPQSNPPSSVQDYGRAQQPQQSNSVSPTPVLHGDIVKARAAIQNQKRKKLEKIMAKLAVKNKITNDEVEKLLRVSDATATRYLEALEKENKIKQTGKTGTAVFYEKI